MRKKEVEVEIPCSFCEKHEDETARLIAGPGELRICSECVHLCAEIIQDDPPAPSVVQETTLVLEDGARHIVASGLREAVSQLGTDDARIVAFSLAAGGRLAVRRQAVRQLVAEPDPEVEPPSRPDWAR